MSNEQLLPQPLWDDARIQSATEWARYRGITKGTRIMLEGMRTDYEVERAKLLQQVKELEEQNYQLERMVSLETTQAVEIGRLRAQLAEREAWVDAEYNDIANVDKRIQLRVVIDQSKNPDGKVHIHVRQWIDGEWKHISIATLKPDWRLQRRKQSEAIDES
jgi:hypothetical protein